MDDKTNQNLMALANEIQRLQHLVLDLQLLVGKQAMQISDMTVEANQLERRIKALEQQ